MNCQACSSSESVLCCRTTSRCSLAFVNNLYHLENYLTSYLHLTNDAFLWCLRLFILLFFFILWMLTLVNFQRTHKGNWLRNDFRCARQQTQRNVVAFLSACFKAYRWAFTFIVSLSSSQQYEERGVLLLLLAVLTAAGAVMVVTVALGTVWFHVL